MRKNRFFTDDVLLLIAVRDKSPIGFAIHAIENFTQLYLLNKIINQFHVPYRFTFLSNVNVSLRSLFWFDHNLRSSRCNRSAVRTINF